MSWTFGRKLSAGLTCVALLTATSALVALWGLGAIADAKDQVLQRHASARRLLERITSGAEQASSEFRGYVISRDAADLAELRRVRGDVDEALAALRELATTAEARARHAELERATRDQRTAQDDLLRGLAAEAPQDPAIKRFNETARPARLARARATDAYVAGVDADLEADTRAVAARAGQIKATVALAGLASVVLAFLVALLLGRTLVQQVGAAVSQVQSSATELQASAAQQAASTREEAASMNEISTTIRELLATSTQIAESAQHVARIAEETAGAARGGDATVVRTQQSVEAMRKQIDAVVQHMLELGKRSQQIGGVVEIVGELAEQTNILSINATIEAAGAGEHGKRFAAVADEIRRLADRVAVSTKEIRGLVEEVRTAVNAAVMATESGAKAVDAGVRQFGEVNATFKGIVAQVVTTTQAAREIELSTKQQRTAVEQVNQAAATITQSSRDMEAAASQVLQTAGTLGTLSRDLGRIITAA